MARRPFFTLAEWLFVLALAVGAATVVYVLIGWVGAYIYRITNFVVP
jgi:hypothetical protein